ncbi:hypothetical protein OOZ19_03415 [Saccharopolyspora sp. NFXS83]|uniref:hypothetical protein n=1 Tax=Saccharopolyspora sp. NFXS83 TaxID=2993560 RepID=UPI00224AE76E|nr:hypothetical protein [Saccharopolyspora sp. NFXS83]MCX2729276.1 hypothetical protein [Saccharopolyspora sp. NFXS83]
MGMVVIRMTSSATSDAIPEQVGERPAKKKPEQVEVKDLREDPRYFIDMSVPLSGFDPLALQGTGMTELYLRVALEHSGSAVLLQLYRHCATEREEKKKDPNRDFRLPEARHVSAVACAIAKMWYLGAWYGFSAQVYAVLVEEAGKTAERLAPNEPYMVSPDAYVNGLLWQLTGGHVPGAKPPGFGSWAKRPVPIPPTPTGPYEETI